ncbi:MAG: hypothetical protein AAFX40_19920 [Cyanobacteria bacterium J06639_1]
MPATVSSNHSYRWDDASPSAGVRPDEDGTPPLARVPASGDRLTPLAWTTRRCPKTGWLDCFLGLAESQLHLRHSTMDATRKIAVHYLIADGRAILEMRRAPEGVPMALWQKVLSKVRSRQVRR